MTTSRNVARAHSGFWVEFGSSAIGGALNATLDQSSYPVGAESADEETEFKNHILPSARSSVLTLDGCLRQKKIV